MNLFTGEEANELFGGEPSPAVRHLIERARQVPRSDGAALLWTAALSAPGDLAVYYLLYKLHASLGELDQALRAADFGLRHAAAAAGLPDGLIGTNGIRIAGQRRAAQLTTPEATDLQALLAEMVAAQVPVAAMEVSSIGLAEDRCEALEFAAVAFLNLTVDHLDYHGDMAAYGEAKRRLFTDLLAPGAIAVINVEDAFGRALADSLTHPLIWRLSLEDPTADVHIRALTLDAAGCRGVLVTPRGELPFDCPLPGRYNAENVATAGALAFAVDLPTGAIARALHRAAIAGRMQTVTNPHGLLTVVDYAHSDDALLRAIEALRPLTRGRLWCVFGCGG
ncbi:MAG: hypothetical protein KDF54_12530, partial [Hydrogenophaga sp.]|nr:hypothetical protein [Hydrogenophaga sp.]